MDKCTCKRCGASWLPRTEEPVQCPRCKSPFWRVPTKAKSKKSAESKEV